jgi:hypothetical protein
MAMKLFVDTTQPQAIRQAAEDRIRELLQRSGHDNDDVLISATRLKSGQWTIYVARLSPPVPELLPTLADMSFPQLANDLEKALNSL